MMLAQDKLDRLTGRILSRQACIAYSSRSSKIAGMRGSMVHRL